MMWLALFWIWTGLFLSIYILSRRFAPRTADVIDRKYGILAVMVLCALLVVAIATNDPVTVLGLDIPTEVQWLGSLLVAGFGSWKFYLDPLKERVINLEKDMSAIKADTSIIKQLLLKGQKKSW